MEYTLQIYHLLNGIGMHMSLKGYLYAAYAIVAFLENPAAPLSCKELYFLVAKKYHTTTSRVERTIRYAIGNTMQNGNPEALAEYFNTACGAPTNYEFIVRLAYAVKRQLRDQSFTLAI